MITRFIDAAGASFRRRPILWLLALAAFFPLFPDVDLWVSGLFYEPAGGFVHARGWFAEFVRKGLPVVLFGALIYLILLWLAGLVFKERFLGIDSRATLFLVSSLAIGPGLIVNSLLKENWGRARPSQIVEFGGERLFTAPWLITDQCDGNCSFTSGHGALGFWVIAFAFLVPQPHRPIAMAVALAFGSVVASVRIIQGGHFLSDTLWSAVIVITVTWLLHRLILKGR